MAYICCYYTDTYFGVIVELKKMKKNNALEPDL